ncbi:MAG: prolyl oligopeptidase family serine peptidase [Planctomycetes bacterium]|nr:prolyl oligopeptidase family serine peptidase [Planctomycetota bacterium]
MRPTPGGCGHLVAIHLLLGASVAASVLAAVTVVCLLARAWSLAAACALGLSAAVSAGALGWSLGWPLRPARRRAARVVLAVSLASGAGLVGPWPVGARPDGGSALTRSVGLDGRDTGAPWFGALPERHLVRLGAWLDLRGEERRWLDRGLFEAAYDRVAAGGAVDATRSLVLDAWLRDRGHLWLAVPDVPGPWPLVVFLHGNGGPFQLYPEVLARAAVSRGFAFVAPTWGFGHWVTGAGRARIAAAVEAVERLHPVDRRRVLLVGLSAGGIGAVEALARDPGRFRACVALSGAPAAVSGGDPALGGRPLLLVHGARDPRVPVAHARALAATTRERGGRVALHEVEDGDHFILLSHEAQVVRLLLDWLSAQG